MSYPPLPLPPPPGAPGAWLPAAPAELEAAPGVGVKASPAAVGPGGGVGARGDVFRIFLKFSMTVVKGFFLTTRAASEASAGSDHPGGWPLDFA